MGKYIRFDWAMKRLLRDKANFGVLEGFLTSLLGRTIKIEHLLESESNQAHENDKFNRVDIMARDNVGDTYLIEIQNNRELDYFHRMLYGVSKFVTEHLSLGEEYSNVKKIYSINIVYFGLGQGNDYVYHGYTEFTGVNDKNDTLQLSKNQIEQFSTGTSKACSKPGDLMPEYYVLRVEDFDKNAVTPLDEWISFIKTGEIPETASAPGLSEARKKLDADKMSPAERKAYVRHLEQLAYERGVIKTGIKEGEAIGLEKGEAIGLEKGRKEGLEKGIEQTVLTGHRNGLSIEQIEAFSGLSREKILEIIKSNETTV